MSEITFTSWSKIKDFITQTKGLTSNPQKGIFFPKGKNTAILKSKDNTSFYDDDLRDAKQVKYTLFGKCGDQDEDETTNRKLLDSRQTKHVYLYRVKPGQWVWYGKYEITGKTSKLHPGEDGIMRTIVVLTLTKIDD
jgi:hypothetical protein